MDTNEYPFGILLVRLWYPLGIECSKINPTILWLWRPDIRLWPASHHRKIHLLEFSVLGKNKWLEPSPNFFELPTLDHSPIGGARDPQEVRFRGFAYRRKQPPPLPSRA